MPNVERGRPPGPVRGAGERPGIYSNPRFGDGFREPGPTGRIGGAHVLLAEVAHRAQDVASEPQPAAPDTLLEEPLAKLYDQIHLKALDTPLFLSAGPRPDDVMQKGLENSPVGAILVAMAHATPRRVVNMITAIPGEVLCRYRLGQRTDTLAAPRSFRVTFAGKPPQRVSNLLYQDSDGIAFTQSDNNCSWMAFIEKAYATAQPRGYVTLSRIDSGTMGELTTNDVFEEMVGAYKLIHMQGETASLYVGDHVSALKPEQVGDILLDAPYRPTIASSSELPGSEVAASRAYAVIEYRRDWMVLRDPRNIDDPELRMKFEDFRKSFVAVFQADNTE